MPDSSLPASYFLPPGRDSADDDHGSASEQQERRVTHSRASGGEVVGREHQRRRESALGARRRASETPTCCRLWCRPARSLSTPTGSRDSFIPRLSGFRLPLEDCRVLARSRFAPQSTTPAPDPVFLPPPSPSPSPSTEGTSF